MTDRFYGDTELEQNMLYDYERYAKHSFYLKSSTREHKRAILRILTHYIEGGMSFPDVRLGYGQEKIASIMDKLDIYINEFGGDETVIWAIATIFSYLEYHADKGYKVDGIEDRITKLNAKVKSTGTGGVENVTKAQISDATDIDFHKFLLNRHSVRQYTDEPISDETIRNIVSNAQECSSVCNRQTVKAYAFNNYETVQELLTYQAGNAGFRQEIRTLFIITANIAHMNLLGERYQGWIDGGIFAQTLALSIHAEGLGACFLNWSVDKDTDIRLRAKIRIPDNELVITFMSAGQLKDRFNVPKSTRKPLEMVLSLNPDIA